ncbi:hypothetical protein ES288_A13G144500v1 [Gossypium darwinii]|uniref:Uncharacterized protein n=2 Tax=Gossypium TaxID=3633 RepID=A0A5D2MKG0_GOSTO|nr:hypothetical protein ES288_A13G144500v1 [Gossypium darwinii]TYH91926.1 hypothetical protein ES332_A13G147100v1 [Gossypium tomentosum]
MLSPKHLLLFPLSQPFQIPNRFRALFMAIFVSVLMRALELCFDFLSTIIQGPKGSNGSTALTTSSKLSIAVFIPSPAFCEYPISTHVAFECPNLPQEKHTNSNASNSTFCTALLTKI